MVGSSRALFALPTLALGLMAPAALGQSVLYTFYGDSPDDVFGWSVSGAGDVNGDGYDDLIVGAWERNYHNTLPGYARVFSGRGGNVLYTFRGDSNKDHFGRSVSGAGDVNADGFDDLIVGAPLEDVWSGSARVFSGMDGSVLYTFDGNSAGDHFGYSVSGAGDVNADGFDDLIVGAAWDDNSGKPSGSAEVFSGVDGSVLYRFEGDSKADGLGFSVSGAGDVNRDGFDDLIVGAPWVGPYSGSARVFSGVDGSVLYTFDAGAYPNGDWFGSSVSGAGDVNADSFDDLIVGTPLRDKNGTDSGMARVFSGVDGSVLYTFRGDSPGDQFGGQWSQGVSGAGDVNGDGFDDLIVGAKGDDDNGVGSGSARVFSGVDGTVLYTFEGSVGDALGYWVSGAGDVNADGLDDLIVGAPGYTNAGSAFVFAGRPPLGTNYCGPAVPNSTGVPGVIRAFGLVDANADAFFLTADQLPNGEIGYFLVSLTQGFFMPPGSKGFICLGGDIGRFNQPGNVGQGPTFTIQVDLTSIPTNPPQPVMAGQTWNFQAWFRDNNPGPTSNFTDGVSITFQ